jgi:hypothetical protein
LLHFISAKGSRNKRIPTANVTLEGILDPKIPGGGGGRSSIEGVGGGLFSINKSLEEGKRNFSIIHVPLLRQAGEKRTNIFMAAIKTLWIVILFVFAGQVQWEVALHRLPLNLGLILFYMSWMNRF